MARIHAEPMAASLAALERLAGCGASSDDPAPPILAETLP